MDSLGSLRSFVYSFVLFVGCCPGDQSRSFKYNLSRDVATTGDSTATRTRCRRSPDSSAVVDDACLAKNLLRSVASDDDEDDERGGRLGAPSVRDVRQQQQQQRQQQQPGCPSCTSTSSAWKISAGVLALPTRDCPLCWAHLPVVDQCDNCSGAETSQQQPAAAHRWSTPGTRITSSSDSATFPASAWIHVSGVRLYSRFQRPPGFTSTTTTTKITRTTLSRRQLLPPSAGDVRHWRRTSTAWRRRCPTGRCRTSRVTRCVCGEARRVGPQTVGCQPLYAG